MSPRKRLIKFFEYAFRKDDIIVRVNIERMTDVITDMVMEKVDERYSYLLETDNE